MSGPTSGPSSANAALEWLRAQREPAPETVREAARRWRDHHRVHFVGAEELLAGVAQRLVAMGMPLVQCSTSLLPLHPEVYAWNYVWRRDEGVVCHVRTHAYIAGQPGDSPFAAIKRGEGPIRLRLEPPPAQLAAPPP